MTSHGATLRRYLRRETFVVCGMALAVLAAIMLALFLAELMGDVADGEVFAATVLELLALRIPEAVVMAAPLALVVGLLMGFGELAQAGEFIVMRAAGLRPQVMLMVVAMLALLWSVAVLIVSGWGMPVANERSAALAEHSADELLLAGIRPGRFESFGAGRLTIYARKVDARERRLEGVFVHFASPDRTEVISARHGVLFEHPETGRQVLSLRDGTHLGHALVPEGRPFRHLRFARNDIELPVGQGAGEDEPARTMNLPELAGAVNQRALRIELLERLVPAIASLVLAVFALPVTLVSSRGSRFGIVLVAVAIYLVYTNTANVVLVRAAAGSVAPELVWLVHLAALITALATLLMWWRRW